MHCVEATKEVKMSTRTVLEHEVTERRRSMLFGALFLLGVFTIVIVIGLALG